MNMTYGRPDSEWEILEPVCMDFLLERARYEFVTSYTELNAALANRTGLRSFDFSQGIDRKGLGYLLYLVAEQTFAESGLLISALCRYLNENDPGDGFYDNAREHGFRFPPTKDGRMEFWQGHVAQLYQRYGRTRS
jgi:hypothetical protein